MRHQLDQLYATNEILIVIHSTLSCFWHSDSLFISILDENTREIWQQRQTQIVGKRHKQLLANVLDNEPQQVIRIWHCRLT